MRDLPVFCVSSDGSLHDSRTCWLSVYKDTLQATANFSQPDSERMRLKLLYGLHVWAAVWVHEHGLILTHSQSTNVYMYIESLH